MQSVRNLLNALMPAAAYFPYQIALAKLDFGAGNVAASSEAVKKLIGTSSPEDAMVARTTLADMYIEKNNYCGAEPLVTEILRLDKRNTAGLRLRASFTFPKANSMTRLMICAARSTMNRNHRRSWRAWALHMREAARLTSPTRPILMRRRLASTRRTLASIMFHFCGGAGS